MTDKTNGIEPFAHLCVLPTKDAGPTKFFTAPSDPRGFPVFTFAQLNAYAKAEGAARDAEIERLRADAARLEVQRDDARFAYRKLKEHIQGDCV